MLLAASHEPALVALSILIAITASYTALDLGGRIQASTGRACYAWLFTAAVAMGGGIWSMHFVAMLAFSLPGIEVNYDVGLTLLSLVLPIIVTAAGFFIVRRRDAKPHVLAASGLFMGAGIVAMHYTGMAAMRMPAQQSYDALLVALSVAIAVGASLVALWLAFRNTGLVQKLLASVVMGVAISGMHYTAMFAVNFHAHTASGLVHAHPGIGRVHLALSVSAATFSILFLAIIATIFDRRFATLASRDAAALRESERRFRLLVDGVTDYAIYMLDPSGRVTNWNHGAERIKGYSAHDIVGQHFSRFYAEEDRRNGIPDNALKTALAKGKYRAEGWRLRKDGSRFWASVVIEALHDEGGEFIGFAKVTRDVTERREAQRQLEEAHEKLLQSQKMEALGQLTGGVAHDFNNLLAAVLGNLELLRKRLPDNPQLTKFLENAYQGAQRGAALTQRMLAFARRQDLKPEAVDIPNLVRDMADLLQRTIGPGVRFETRFPVRLARAHVDANQLELAILNLAVNSRDAMSDGGTITIAAHLETLDVGNDLGLPPGEYLRVCLSDTGAGMDEVTLSRASEPFFTTKPSGRGTGLGLSMVHGLAEQSGGRLVLKSRRGEGTTAEIFLPVAAEDVASRSAATMQRLAPQGEPPLRKLCVLVVDDDSLVLSGTAAMIEDLGHRVLEASSGRQALACLTRDEGVELVVTDQVMAEMTGLELADEIRRKWPQIPVILATGYAELTADSGLHLLKLSKPFSQDMLSWAISEASKESRPAPSVVAFRQRAPT